MNCNLSISRERRMGYAARNIRIYLDGSVMASLGNGKTVNVTISPGSHNIGLAIGNTIVTEITCTIEEGTSSVCVICWIESMGGITARLTDYTIPHKISERETFGKVANKAVIATLAVIFTLFAVWMIFKYVFILSLI